jgi:hypothetical protein
VGTGTGTDGPTESNFSLVGLWRGTYVGFPPAQLSINASTRPRFPADW